MPSPGGRPISRRALLQSGLLLGGAAILGAAGFAAYEPYELSREQLEIRLPGLPPALDGFRVAQLSDIHFGEYILESHLSAVVTAVNAGRPDLVVITGDFVTHSLFENRKAAAQQAWPCAAILRNLRAPQGVLATLGNHDVASDAAVVAAALEGSGIPVLRNRPHAVETRGARLWIAGLDDALAGRPDPDAAMRGIPPGEAVIAAVHEPDFADEMLRYPIGLQISGHSHGGQVRLPAAGAIYLPPMARKYPAGLRRLGSMQLYTNRGIGVIGVPFRFLCPPELTLYTLRAA